MSDDIETSPIYFASEVLGMRPYWWQDTVLTWFENAPGGRVKGSLCTPNGAGKDSVIIAALALWWVSMFARGRVVITSRDARQIDEQTWPSIARHRSKFEGWKWIERECETPTGGRIIAFTTDDEARCEGFHRETGEDGLPNNHGPLLLCANEAKSIDEGIFTAFDRCTYDGLLYASSPGPMHGRFWESHTKPELGFRRMKVGLEECPHIPQERIADIVATYGERHPFTLSTLHGEFMLDGAESRFHFDGLEYLRKVAAAQFHTAVRGTIHEHKGRFVFMRDEAGWALCFEEPRPGLEYLGIADPATGEQSEGSLVRDMSACGILRNGYIDAQKNRHETELVAVLHAEDGVRWDLDIVAYRLHLLAGYYGGCTIAPEANNSGVLLIKELKDLGASVWQREDIDHLTPGKTVKKSGFLTTSKTKTAWVETLARAIREREFVCKYPLVVEQFAAFIQKENGSCEARPGAHDDWVAAVGIGLLVSCFSRMPFPAEVRSRYDGPETASTRGKAVA